MIPKSLVYQIILIDLYHLKHQNNHSLSIIKIKIRLKSLISEYKFFNTSPPCNNMFNSS